jgi:hypothetical protein
MTPGRIVVHAIGRIDDQPFALNISGMMSVPYSLEVCVGKSQSGEEFCQMIIDQFDQLYKEGGGEVGDHAAMQTCGCIEATWPLSSACDYPRLASSRAPGAKETFRLAVKSEASATSAGMLARPIFSGLVVAP